MYKKEDFDWITIIDEENNQFKAIISIVDINNQLYAIVSYEDEVIYIMDGNDYIGWQSNEPCTYFRLEIENNEKFLVWIENEEECDLVDNFIGENLNNAGQLLCEKELEESSIRFKGCLLAEVHC